MKRGLVQWAGVFFSASMLVIAGCASSDAGSDDVQVVPDDNTQAQPGDRAVDTGESAYAEEDAVALAPDESDQALQQGPASVMVPGLTILGGTVSGSGSDSDWNLDTGTGLRTWTRYEAFPDGAFSSPPSVSASIGYFYARSDTNRTYVKVAAESVTVSGFNMKVTVYSDTVLYAAHARWIAFGPN